MYIFREVPFDVVWRFGWKNVVRFILYGIFICSIHFYCNEHHVHLHIPFSLIGPIGVAVAIYAGFKNSQSYDRTWEARKNWGALCVATRILGNHLSTYIQPGSDVEVKTIVDRQLAYLNAHKLQLRKRMPHSRKFKGTIRKFYFGEPDAVQWDREVGSRLSEKEYEAISKSTNKALQIMYLQYHHLKQLFMEKKIDEYKLVETIKNLDSCVENQGKNERIKTTPFPRQYAFFSKTFVIVFILILPLGILDLYKSYTILGYAALVLLYTLISWLYVTIELVGDNSEDPFENAITDIPMSSLVRNVEIDLYEHLDFHPKPEKVEAVNGVLM